MEFLKRPVSLWITVALILLAALAAGVAAWYLQGDDARHAIVAEGADAAFLYGSEPQLSDPEFFGKVKQELIDEKGSFIEANLSSMKLTVYKDGVPVKEVAILTKGRPGSWWETPAGLYEVELKKENHFSSFGKVYQPWSVAFQGNFFIHGWPYYPGGEPVASSFSGGCIRLSTEDAKAVYDLATVKMPVLVFEEDFAADDFSYQRKTPSSTAESYLVADLQNNFVIMKKDAEASLPLGAFGQFLGGMVAAEYVNLEKGMTVGEGIALTSSSRLSVGQTVTPFDLLHLMLIASRNEPLGILADYLGESRLRELITRKLASIGLKDTRFERLDDAYASQGTTTPEDLFKLAKYLYNNRSFLLEISNGKVSNAAYGASHFGDLGSDNPLYKDKRLVGGKVSLRDDGASDFVGVFKLDIHGTERPVFVFLGRSVDLKGDLERTLAHIQSSF